MFKKLFTIIPAVILLVLLLAAWNGAAQPAPAQPRLITVSGSAEVRTPPNEVVLTLGVETWNEALGPAKQENDTRVAAVLKTAQSFGVEPKYLQTDHISIEPTYEDYSERRKITGYAVRKTIVVTLKDVSRFEALLTAVLEGNGANHVHGIEFRTTELRKYRDQARSLAIKAAQEKAQAMAGELGQPVGRPYSIQENHSYWGSGYNSWWGSRWGGGPTQNVMQEMGSGASLESDSTLAPGQITVSAQVTVSFELLE
jgi:hypothetical protein